MSANLNAQETNNAVNRIGGFVWNRLRSERENICEALLKESRPVSVPQAGFAGVSKADAPDSETWHRDLLQARLTKIDDALDRLMAAHTATVPNAADGSRTPSSILILP